MRIISYTLVDDGHVAGRSGHGRADFGGSTTHHEDDREDVDRVEDHSDFVENDHADHVEQCSSSCGFIINVDAGMNSTSLF